MKPAKLKKVEWDQEVLLTRMNINTTEDRLKEIAHQMEALEDNESAAKEYNALEK